MIIFEFAVLSISLILLMFTIFMSFIKSITSPIREIHLITLSSIFFILNVIFFMVSAYLHSPNIVNPLGETFHKFGQSFAYLGIMFLTLTLLIPNFKATYKHLTELSLIIVISISAALINYFTVIQEVKSEVIVIRNTSVGSLLTIISLIFLIFILMGRSRQINKMLQKENVQLIKTKPFGIFSFLLAIIALFFLFARFGFEFFPAYGYFLPFSVTIFYFTLFFVQRIEIFFLTPIELYRIVIIQKKSGMELYSKSFPTSDTETDDFFSEILTGATSSLKTVLDAKRGLEQIRYFDRVIQSAEENDIIAYIIVSDYNVITSSIVNWLAKKFYNEFIKQQPNIKRDLIDKQKFVKFDKYVDIARKYIPF